MRYSSIVPLIVILLALAVPARAQEPPCVPLLADATVADTPDYAGWTPADLCRIVYPDGYTVIVWRQTSPAARVRLAAVDQFGRETWRLTVLTGNSGPYGVGPGPVAPAVRLIVREEDLAGRGATTTYQLAPARVALPLIR